MEEITNKKFHRLADDFKNFRENYQIKTNWTLQDGYKDADPDDSYPIRAALGKDSDGEASFQLILSLNRSNIEPFCQRPTDELKGFKIILHSPDELPNVKKNFFQIGLNQVVNVNVKPEYISTSDKLRAYTPEQRKCFFDGERTLQFFRVYNQNNCEIECLANYTLTMCGCSKFFMPRLNDTEICETVIWNSFCNRAARDKFIKENLYKFPETSNEEYNQTTQCNCLPACTSLKYLTELSLVPREDSIVPLHMQEEFETGKNIYNKDLSFSEIKIQFSESQFTYSKRKELYGWQDFVANIGGLIGLFLGFSLLSIVEILYHLTLRFAINLKLKKPIAPKTAPNKTQTRDIEMGSNDQK